MTEDFDCSWRPLIIEVITDKQDGSNEVRRGDVRSLLGVWIVDEDE